MHNGTLINVVTQLAEMLDRRGIAWCVLRNYDTFPRPRSDTSDIDFLLGCKFGDALFLLETIVTIPVGIGKVIVSRSNDVISFFLTVPLSPTLHIDFVFGNLWMGCPLDSSTVLLADRQLINKVPIPARGHEAANSLTHYLFHRGVVKPEYRQRISIAATECRSDFIRCLAPIWGAHLASTIVERAAAADWDWFASWQRIAKRELLLLACVNPVAAIQTSFGFAANTLRRMMWPPGLWIAFLGPDGCGKTTVGNAYRTRLSTLFQPQIQRHLHWRPGWLPAPGSLTGSARESINTTEPHAMPTHGGFVSFMRFVYFLVDYVIGHWLKVRPLLAKGGLVTFDRYYQDFLIDPLRYRLRLPVWLLRMAARLVPQPELLFVLNAPADVLHRRKQELPLAEIATQLDALRRLAADCPSAHVVRVDRSVDEIVDELERVTLDYLNQRNRRRLGWR